MLLRRAVGASTSTSNRRFPTAWRERSGTEHRDVGWYPASLRIRLMSFSALEAGEIDEAANIAPFAQVGERLVDLIELVVAGDQLV